MFDQKTLLIYSSIFSLLFLSISMAQNIDSVTPTQNQLNVEMETNIAVVFDAEMNAATINDSAFFIHGSRTGLHTGTYDYESVTRTATFDPDNNFAAGEVVKITLTQVVQTQAGDSISTSYQWSFTIETSRGSSSFLTKTDYLVGGALLSVISADLDGDSDMDLAASNLSRLGVSVLLNNGDDKFAQPAYYTA